MFGFEITRGRKMKYYNSLDMMPGYGVLCVFGIDTANGELLIIGQIEEDKDFAFINCEIVDNLGNGTMYHAGDVTRWALFDEPEGDFESSLYGAD